MSAGRNGPPSFWWAVHNIVAHPVSHILHMVGLRRLSAWLHDETLPAQSRSTDQGAAIQDDQSNTKEAT